MVRRRLRRWLPAARVTVALAIVVALVVQFVETVDSAFRAVNFFSFFTVLSNLLACAVLLWAAARPPSTAGAGVSAIRGAATLYMGVTAIVYAVLLAPASADVGLTLPWVDAVVHEIAPLYVLFDWFADPPRRRPSWRSTAGWLVPPLAYLAYSLARGVAEDWYPYPFLDPGESGGYAGVAGYSIGVLVVFAVLAAAVRWGAGRGGAGGPVARVGA